MEEGDLVGVRFGKTDRPRHIDFASIGPVKLTLLFPGHVEVEDVDSGQRQEQVKRFREAQGKGQSGGMIRYVWPGVGRRWEGWWMTKKRCVGMNGKVVREGSSVVGEERRWARGDGDGDGEGEERRVLVGSGPAVVSCVRRFVFGEGDAGAENDQGNKERKRDEKGKDEMKAGVRRDEVVIAPAFVLLSESDGWKGAMARSTLNNLYSSISRDVIPKNELLGRSSMELAIFKIGS